MTTAYADPTAKARKIEAQIMRAVHAQTQHAIAASLGVHESTISRLLSEHLPKLAEVMARAGLKVVPHNYRCVDPELAHAVELLHERAIKRAGGAVSLMWEDDE